MLEIADKVIDGIKTLRDIAKRIENAELHSRFADLMMASADLKMEMAELKAEIFHLRQENAALKRKADLRSKMQVKDRLLYATEPIPGYDGGPFCPLCFEKEGILVNVWESTMGWYCPQCEKKP
jgi:hypothetical protein